MKTLYRFFSQAKAAAEDCGKVLRESTCDAWKDIDEIDDEQLQREDVAGVVECYKTEDGDIFAWWVDDDDLENFLNGRSIEHSLYDFGAGATLCENHDDEIGIRDLLCAGTIEEVIGQDDFADAMTALDLTAENHPKHIYRVDAGLICFGGDWGSRLMRGGARPGAGRKPATGEPRVTVAFRVTPRTRDAMRALKDRGINIAIEFDRMVDELAKGHNL